MRTRSDSEHKAFLDFLLDYAKTHRQGFDRKFVKEYYAIMFEFTGSSEFVYDMHRLAEWIKMPPNNVFSHTIKHPKSGFVEGKDYIVEQWTRRGPSNLRIRPVKLTEQCFIGVAMMAPGEVGQKVRQYYIWLESALKLYMRQEVGDRSDRILELEQHLKSKESIKAIASSNEKQDGHGSIYILPASENLKDAVRMGRTTEFINRMQKHNSPRASPTMPMYTIKTMLPICVESLAKHALKPLQYDGSREIFFVQLDRLKTILKLSGKICTQVSSEVDERNVQNRPLAMKALSKPLTKYGNISSSISSTDTELNALLRKLSRNSSVDEKWCVVLSG